MSDIGISYDARTQPDPISIGVALEVSGTEIRARVTDIQPFVCTLTPSGNISEMVLSSIAWPLAQTIGVILPTKATDIVAGFGPISIATVGPTQQSIAGQTLTITPANMQMSNWNGMLKVDCDLAIG